MCIKYKQTDLNTQHRPELQPKNCDVMLNKNQPKCNNVLILSDKYKTDKQQMTDTIYLMSDIIIDFCK